MTHTAVITGGSSGIGWATAQAMLARGWQVVSVAQEAPPETLPGLHAEICDLADSVATAATAARIAAAHDISHIVHNAGQILPALVADADPASILRLAQLHLATPLTLTQAFLPGMKARRFGRILFTGSRAALACPPAAPMPPPRPASSAWRAPGRWNWRRRASPSTWSAPARSAPRTSGTSCPKAPTPKPPLPPASPWAAWASPPTYARALMFLADPDAGFITGQVLMVCGGASIGAFSL
jgi:3-oxoacyl-[acyl-carrier protein] reductase